MDVRLLTAPDAAASTLLSQHAFGAPAGGRPAFTLSPGLRRWGMFDQNTLTAKANDRDYHSMVGGRRVSTAGVAGVVVAPEYRGSGLARQVMTHLLAEARRRGAVISTLFRTAPGLYRSLGYEEVAELVDGTYPAAALAGTRAERTTVRRARTADGPTIRKIYADLAASGSMLLTRDGACFTASDPELIAAFDGITVAEEDGRIVGYASWDRRSGYGQSSVLAVTELLSLTGDGYRALLSTVGSFGSVAPTVALRTSGTDPVHWLVPGAGWQVTEVRQYMLRIVDLAGAVAARGWPPGAQADVVLEVADPLCPWNSGRHRLLVQDGDGRIEPVAGTSSGPTAVLTVTTVTPGGLAVLYAGGVPVSTLRRGGLLTGGSASGDAELDAAFAGPRPAILDYF